MGTWGTLTVHREYTEMQHVTSGVAPTAGVCSGWLQVLYLYNTLPQEPVLLVVFYYGALDARTGAFGPSWQSTWPSPKFTTKVIRFLLEVLGQAIWQFTACSGKGCRVLSIMGKAGRSRRHINFQLLHVQVNK